ncbi:MAG TPA: AAA family ATPase [Cyanobacteria bacterium UBA11369]|nr:AAA family ATPase [Cyanobacteria bacterium UBA11371]HBE34966.1 AAA family ATPase [Cyanobacteria bacterium UBA11368]HBE49022.1 AAA family ATPase [Cyanobacteria bacterium UBA11369]
MKVESILIENFKRFEHLEVSFKNQTLNEVSNRFLVVGDNGTGKTTLLQAIALPLALATRQIQSVSDFDWLGFLPGRFQRWGHPYIELVVSFEDEEIEATQAVARRWLDTQPDRSGVEPGDRNSVQLILDGESCRARTSAEYCQFWGRYYAQQLLKTDPSVRSEFAKLPGIFWVDQFRNLGVRSQIEEQGNGSSKSGGGRVSFEVGVSRLRKYLNGWKFAQLTHSYTFDYLMQLENLYQKIFPGRSFAGVEPMPGIDSPTPEDYYFLINDGHRTYDIVEMSAGEQSVFPILYEFVRQQIAYSVVLIDEIELNLHPPAAQLLVRQLTKLSQNCQFIFTTHSEAVSDVIGEDETYSLLVSLSSQYHCYRINRSAREDTQETSPL